jgi:ADP-ribosylglycohydrolase
MNDDPPGGVGDAGPDMAGRFAGCLLGGAVGDALGAPVEFSSMDEIRRSHGAGGVTGYLRSYGRLGAVTDDTQMTLFTAEGLLRAEQRMRDRGLCNLDAALLRAYQRWLSTQVGSSKVPWDPDFAGGESGWLVTEPFLRHRRAPGSTCLSALSTPDAGRLERPVNDSKGCGGVMRVAPVGLVACDPFDVACRAAALTHGHPSGWISAGALAVIVATLTRGASLPVAVEAGQEAVAGHPKGREVVEALRAAVALAESPVTPGPEAVESLGAGWVGEEALAIAVYCALSATSFRAGVLAAVNHSGDSDSTGAIAGNILGVHLGASAIPPGLTDELEGGEVIARVARDLHDAFVIRAPIDFKRYPTW